MSKVNLTLMIDKSHESDEIQKIIEILLAINNTIDSKTDVVWTRYDRPEQLSNDLKKYIEKLESGDYTILATLNHLFGPTGTFQELSISNGWGEEFLNIAEQFDHYYAKFLSK